MALDNLLALFMLPLFGALSDKTKPNKLGKRKPYILIGTLCAVLCFVGLTIVDNTQLAELSQGDNSTYWTENYTVTNNEYDSYSNNDVDQEYTIQNYASQILFNSNYADLTADQQQLVGDWYNSIDTTDALYNYDRDTNTYTLTNDGSTNAFTTVVNTARSAYAAEITAGQTWVLVLFVILLLATLISMATFRSPAVALMPDVTTKPLRSKGNAVINLMGTAGGMLVLGLGIVFGTGSADNQIMSYTAFVCAVCGIMLVALTIFMLFVKENEWNSEMLSAQAQLDQAEGDNADATAVTPTIEEKLPKDKLKSLILILSSVALWFIGYNAIISKFSLYAVNVINQDFNVTLLIAQGAAIVSYIPVGMLAIKIGRKKSILIGISLLTASFAGAIFVTSATPGVIMYVLFALAGIAWATINVNSFPMVVELSQGSSIGKFTGYYYTASMAAQIVTPILSGAIMDAMGNMTILFPYGAFFVALSFVTMLFVKHGDSKPTATGSKLEMLDVD